MKFRTLPTNRIAEIRGSKKLTQQALADRLGSHWITVSKLERGKMRLTEEWLARVAEALEVETHEVLPSDRILTTIPIEGELFEHGDISYYEENDPHTVTIHNSTFHVDGLMWFYVNGPALRPMFQDGDILGFRSAHGRRPQDFGERLCLCWMTPGNKTVVGFVHEAGPRKHTIQPLNGPAITNVFIHSFAVLKHVQADLGKGFDDEMDSGVNLDRADDL